MMNNFTLILLLLGMPQFLLAVIQSAVSNNVVQNMSGATKNVPGQLTLLADVPSARNSLKMSSRSQTLPSLSISRKNGVRNSVVAKAVSGGGFGSGSGDGYSSDDEGEKHKEVHALSWVLLREFQSSLRQLPVLMGDKGSISHKDLDNLEVVATLFLVLNKGRQTQSMLASALKLFMALRLRKRLLFHSDHIYRIQYRLEELEETGRPPKHLLASLDLGYMQDELWTPLGIESPQDAFMDAIGEAKNTFEDARLLLNVVKANEPASAAFAANVMKDLFEAEILLGYIENILKKCKNFRGWEDKDPPKPNGWDEPPKPKPKPNGWGPPNGSMN